MTDPATHDRPEEGEEVEVAQKPGADSSKQISVSSPDEQAPPLPNEQAPPLPDEQAPLLPDEAPPDDGWDAIWDHAAQNFYFYNRFTQASQWENPRVPEATHVAGLPADIGSVSHDQTLGSIDRPPGTSSPPKRSIAGGYNPAIHGNYDPTADYAIEAQASDDEGPSAMESSDPNDPNNPYGATGHFNRFTGRWQNAALNPENYNDDNKTKRQMNAFFDITHAANDNGGKSLKEERQKQKLSKKEVKAFKAKKKAKREEKKRAWLRD